MYIDFIGSEIKIGDRVILGKSKDVCFGIITNFRKQYPDYSWCLVDIKLEVTDVTVTRRSNQIIKYEKNIKI